jgi:hypothetical protein
MKPHSPDTSPDIEHLQVAGLRRFGPARRFQLLRSLTATTRALSWQTFRRLRPQLSAPEAASQWAALLYGPEWAQRVHPYPTREQQMIHPDILEALAPVIEALNQLGIPYHLGGSVASSVHGIGRSTLDADLIADLQPQHGAPLVALLEADYYIDAAAVQDAIRRRASFNVLYQGNMIKVDIFVSGGHPLDPSERQRTQSQTFEFGDRAITVNLASPEDTILRKLLWYRMTGGTSERQWGDIGGVLKMQLELDHPYLQQWAVQLQVADLLTRAFAEAGIDPSSPPAP